MHKTVMVEVPGVLGPYPAMDDGNGWLRFNRPTVERIGRDSQAPLGMGSEVPGEGKYLRLGENGVVEFCRLADGVVGEHVVPELAVCPDGDGCYWVASDAWPWEVVQGSRGQVWGCCASPFGPVCGHQQGL